VELIRIIPQSEEPKTEERLFRILHVESENVSDHRVIRTANELEQVLAKDELKGKKILFAAALGEDGINLELYAMLRLIRRRDAFHTEEKGWLRGCLAGSTGVVVVDGASEYYTKSIGRGIVQTANMAGCMFPGRPLVEGTGSLKNYTVQAQNSGLSLYEAYECAAHELMKRLEKFTGRISPKKEILCVHACNPETSNTYWLWKQIRERLSKEIGVKEISLRDGQVLDCAGCSYETCMYFSQNAGCFYGGTIVEEVYPALENCGALVLLCPNYNDALGANLTAFINRLTAPFRRKPFEDKLLFSVVVSGYSGADIVGRQLIDALNMNKSFQLPGNFVLSETANASGSVANIAGIQEKVQSYAEYLEDCISQNSYLSEAE
jgi:multimeric flavodoxin WrbA